MENIFNQIKIKTYYFNDTLNDISDILYFYLEDNLEDENYQTLRWDLQDALKNNVNEEYI
jgi:hypothetical protein